MTRARGFSWASCTPTCRCRRTTRGVALRHLSRVHRRLPDAGHRRAVHTRRTALHFLSDDRNARLDSDRVSHAIGNRIYGCDDCQLFCPWNKFAKPTGENDFAPRHGLATADLGRTCSPGTRIPGWRTPKAVRFDASVTKCWLRNIAVGLGNAKTTPAVIAALNSRRTMRLGAGYRACRVGA